jgi:hypothetical protein
MDIFIKGERKQRPNSPQKQEIEYHEEHRQRIKEFEKQMADIDLLRKWSEIPYPGQCEPPVGLDRYAGSWPTYYFRTNEKGLITTLEGEPVCFDIENPDEIDFNKSLMLLKHVLKNLTPQQRKIAEYWGEGPATKRWTPIIDRLIDTYNLSPAYAARVLAAVHAGINDAFVICWYFKYLWDVPRPIQLDKKLATEICTPPFPTYPSGHSVISGTAEVILSYFFPTEAEKISELAEENGISRLFGGVHFLEDIIEGLKLGRQIGKIIVDELKRQEGINGDPIDVPPVEDRNADLPPPPYV